MTKTVTVILRDQNNQVLHSRKIEYDAVGSVTVIRWEGQIFVYCLGHHIRGEIVFVKVNPVLDW